jgi:hypothetical protein
VAIKLGLDVTNRWSDTRMKRLTHAQALELLRNKTGKATVEEFLAMPQQEAWIALGCYSTNIWNSTKNPYNPLYMYRRW